MAYQRGEKKAPEADIVLLSMCSYVFTWPRLFFRFREIRWDCHDHTSSACLSRRIIRSHCQPRLVRWLGSLRGGCCERLSRHCIPACSQHWYQCKFYSREYRLFHFKGLYGIYHCMFFIIIYLKKTLMLLKRLMCHFKVILGGGREYMIPRDMQDPEYPSVKGDRYDGKNLIVEWLRNKKVRGVFHKCVHFCRIIRATSKAIKIS